MRKCSHMTSRYTWRDDGHGHQVPLLRLCVVCGAKLAFGPSNDDPPRVAAEIEAAEIELWVTIDRLSIDGPRPSRSFGAGEISGWHAHDDLGATDYGIREVSDFTGRTAGYLAREIATHDDREARDADAWPWDPSRLVVGQWEEWVEEMRDFRENGNGDPDFDEDAEPVPFPESCPVTTATISSLVEDVQAAGGALPYGGCEPVASGDPIADLIAASTIGAGLANIETNGIEAELADLQDELDAQAWRLHAPVTSHVPPHDGFPGREEQARERERLSPMATNAGDPVDSATERTAAGIAVEDALRWPTAAARDAAERELVIVVERARKAVDLTAALAVSGPMTCPIVEGNFNGPHGKLDGGE